MDLPPLFTPDPQAEAREAGLAQLLFGPCEKSSDLRCYLLLDAAASPDITICLDGFSAQAHCLFDGAVREDLAEVAPWLVEVTRHAPVFSWFVEEGFGKGWGIALHSPLPAANLKARLKRFLKITDEKDDTYFFKFYVPRNLNAILPELEPEQRTRFFSGIESIWAEDYDDAGLIWRHDPPQRPAVTIDLAAVGRPLLPHPGDHVAETQAILRKLREAP